MQAVRRLILARSQLAALICIAALALRVLIPAGYMISDDARKSQITLCSGIVQQQQEMATGEPDTDHTMPEHDKSKEHGKAEMPCAFSSLATQALGGAGAILLDAALAVVAGRALHASPPTAIFPAPYLRPPLRGPPLLR
ncbi:hypothetical protein [Novosphingobium gossypii]|uniref:hypothetical protein n=1 Tax=Novosphingobium gossypii TaxID=1604774 RepID=UPI003D1A6F76